MNSDDDARIAKQASDKSEKILKRIRRPFYWLSLGSLAYLNAGLVIRFRIFEDGKTGFGLPEGIAIQGVTEEHFRWVLFFGTLFLFVRFVWNAAIYLSGQYTFEEYERRKKYVDEVYSHMDGVSEGLQDIDGPEQIYILYAARLKFWFSHIKNINKFILPFALPIVVGLVAICQLANSLWCQS